MGKVIIRVLGGISQDCFLRGIEEFNKENESKIEAEIVEMTSNKTSNEIHDLCLKALRPNASDEKIDVLEIPAWAQEFAQMGWLYPIDNLSDEERARFFPQFLIPLTWRNKLYGLPEYRDLGVLYYRTDMVTDPPQTWDELICQAEKFQADLRKQQTFAYGFLFQGAKTHSLVCNFLEFVNNAGGNLVDNQGNFNPDALTDPQNPQPVDALKFMWNLVNAQITPDDILTYDERKTGKTFWDSSAVFSRDWLYVWGLAKKYNANTWGKMSIAPLPRKELSLPPSYLIGGWDLVISSTSDHRQEALKLVKFLILNPYLQLERAKCHASLPTLKEIYENHEFLEIFQGTCLPVTSDGWKEFLQSQVKFPPANPQWSTVSEALSNKLWEALSPKNNRNNLPNFLEEAKQETKRLTGELPKEGLSISLFLNVQGCQLEIKRRDTNECWTRNLIKRIGKEKFQFDELLGREFLSLLVKCAVQEPLRDKEWRPDYIYGEKEFKLRKRIDVLRNALKYEFWQELRLSLPATTGSREGRHFIESMRGRHGGFEIPYDKPLDVKVQNPPGHLIIFLAHLFNQIYGFHDYTDRLKTFLKDEDLVEAYKAKYLEPTISDVSIRFSDNLDQVWVNTRSYTILTEEVVPLLELSFKKIIKNLSFFHGDFLWKHGSEVDKYLNRFEALNWVINENLGFSLIQIDGIAEKNYRFRLKLEYRQITIPTLLEPKGIENLAAVANKIYVDEREEFGKQYSFLCKAIGSVTQNPLPKDEEKLWSLVTKGKDRCYPGFY